MRQRDAFISGLFERAKKDKDICLISVDMGAPSLDQWRERLPDQFFAAGISEQNAINFAAGMTASGKKVYVYFMACWAARCFEQVRYSCAMAKNPITILGNGPALGYAPAGPAHCPNEDMAYMRSLCGIEIYSPANSEVADALVDLTLTDPKLRYIRLERSHPSRLDSVYDIDDLNSENLKAGFGVLKPGDNICILSSGYMLGRSLEVAERLDSQGVNTAVIDLFKIKPVDEQVFKTALSKYDLLITVEEQTLSGGFGSAVCELVNDSGMCKRVLRVGLPENYIFLNASREYLLDNHGLSVSGIHEKIIEFIRGAR